MGTLLRVTSFFISQELYKDWKTNGIICILDVNAGRGNLKGICEVPQLGAGTLTQIPTPSCLTCCRTDWGRFHSPSLQACSPSGFPHGSPSLKKGLLPFSLFLSFFILLKYSYLQGTVVSGVQQSDPVLHVYNSLHLLVPNSQAVPPLPPVLATTGLFSLSVSLFLCHK